MTAEQFAELQIQKIKRWLVVWKDNHEFDPESYPDEMDIEDWYEQLYY